MFPKEIRILVVDDSANIRQIVCENLRRIGFNDIETSADAIDGFSKLNHNLKSGKPIGLVLSDLNMPGPSGLDFLKMVRDNAAFRDLPFLLVTTESEKGAVIQAAVAGVSSYVVKPFNVDTLIKRLGDAWKKHNAAA